MSRPRFKLVTWAENRRGLVSRLQTICRSLLAEVKPSKASSRETKTAWRESISLAHEGTDASAYFIKRIFTSTLHSNLYTLKWDLQEVSWPEMTETSLNSGLECGKFYFFCMFMCKAAHLRTWITLRWTNKWRISKDCGGENNVVPTDEEL